jgi:lambda repressor-like predicted transcriptional regulator
MPIVGQICMPIYTIRIQTHVAGLLGVDKSDLWPRRYKKAG